MNSLHTGVVWIALAVSLALGPAETVAQVQELEPNNACLAAQIVGALPGLPTIVTGSLDIEPVPEPPGYDVDFYRFDAAPGVQLRTELRGSGSGVGSLGDPFLGIFDSGCNLLAVNDDSELGLESRIDFDVPADGVFIIAASGCCDNDFNGAHSHEGSYELGILDRPPAIGSISGRVVDAVSGAPLPGDEPPYAFAEIFRCGNEGCFYYLAFIPVGGDGRFRIQNDNDGNPISAGSYLIASSADGYEPAETGPFSVGPAEDFDIGDIVLSKPPLVFARVQPCADLPAEGGVCRYSVSVRNNTANPIAGLGWSIVQASGTGSPLGYSLFPARHSQPLRLPPNSSRLLEFSFGIPAGVAEGGVFCAEGWFSDRETAFLGTLHHEVLFCVSKRSGAFRVMERKVAAGLLKLSGEQRREAGY